MTNSTVIIPAVLRKLAVWSQLAKGWSELFVNIGQDIRTLVSCIWQCQRQLWVQIGVFAVLFLAITSSYWSLSIVPGGNGGYCTPGGIFRYDGAYDRWASEHMFQITNGFGRMSFTQAKIIDTIWDIIVGRGGQFFLSWITFIVFSKSLNCILEQPHACVSYDLFRAIIFEGPTVSSTIKLPRDLNRKIGWRAALSIVWFVLASTYVIIFPTITSAMTGYSSNVAPFFKISSGQKVPLNNIIPFNRAIYRINDADRIEGLNLTLPYLVGRIALNTTRTTAEEEYAACIQYLPEHGDPDRSDACYMALGVSLYILSYIENRTNPWNSDSVFKFKYTDYPVKAPGLNISIFNTCAYTCVPSQFSEFSCEELPNCLSPTYQTTTPDDRMYAYDGQTEIFNVDKLNGKGSCDSQTTYMWGLSFLLLFIFFVTTGVWVFGMYVMWDDAFWNSQLDVAGRHTGFYRGLIDITNAMHRDMLQQPDGLASESQIREMLAERKNGGKIAYDAIDRGELPLPRMLTLDVWRKSIPSFYGWTEPWDPLHWLEWILITGFGLVLVTIPSLTNLYTFQQFRLALAGPFLLLAAVLTLTGLGSTIWRWSKTKRGVLSRSYQPVDNTTRPLADNTMEMI